MFRSLLQITPEGVERLRRSLQVHTALAMDPDTQLLGRHMNPPNTPEQTLPVAPTSPAPPFSTASAPAASSGEVLRTRSDSAGVSPNKRRAAHSATARRAVQHRQRVCEHAMRAAWAAADRKVAIAAAETAAAKPPALDRRHSFAARRTSTSACAPVDASCEAETAADRAAERERERIQRDRQQQLRAAYTAIENEIDLEDDIERTLSEHALQLADAVTLEHIERDIFVYVVARALARMAQASSQLPRGPGTATDSVSHDSAEGTSHCLATTSMSIMTAANSTTTTTTTDDDAFAGTTALLVECEEHASQLFDHIDFDGRRCIAWADFTELLIEEAEQATRRRATAGEFDRYVLRPNVRVPEGSRRVLLVQRSRMLLFITRETTLLCYPEKLEPVHELASHAIVDAVLVGAPSADTTGNSVSRQLNSSAKRLEGISAKQEHDGHSAGPRGAAMLPMAIVTAGSDLHLRIYDLGPRSAARFPLRELKAMRCEASVTKLLLCGTKLFMGDRDGHLIAMDVATVCSAHEREIQSGEMGRARPHTKAITALLALPTQVIVSASLDGRVCTTDANTLAVTHRFFAQDGGIAAIAHSPRQGFLITQGFARTTKVWVGFQGTRHFTLFDGANPHLANVVAVECIDELQQILTADASGLVKAWSLTSNAPLFDSYVVEKTSASRRAAGGGPINDTSVAPLQYFVYLHRARRFITVGHRVASVADFVPGRAVLRSHDEPVRSVAASATAGVCATASTTAVKLWSVARGGLVRGFVLDRADGDVTALAIDPTGTKLCCAMSRGGIVVQRLQSGRRLKTFSHADTTTTPGSPGMAAPSSDGSVALQPERQQGTCDVVAMCYYCGPGSGVQEGPGVRELGCVYTDGYIRIFSDVGTSRLPTRVMDSAFEDKRRRLTALEREGRRHAARSRDVPRVGRPAQAPQAGASSRAKGGVPVDGEDGGSVGGYGIVAAAFGTHSRLIAAVTTTSRVRCIDFLSSTGAPLHEFTVAGDVTCLTFLDPYPCLAVGDSTGGISFFLVRPAALIAMDHDSPHANCRIEHTGTPLALTFDFAGGLVLVGDQRGAVTLYDIRGVLVRARLAPITETASIDGEFARQRRLRDAQCALRQANAAATLGSTVKNVTAGMAPAQLRVGEATARPDLRAVSFLSTARREHLEDLELAETFADLNEMESSCLQLRNEGPRLACRVGAVEVSSDGQVSHLIALPNSYVITADFNGNVLLWAPRLGHQVLALNPSSVLPAALVDLAELTTDEIKVVHARLVREQAAADTAAVERRRLTEAMSAGDGPEEPFFSLTEPAEPSTPQSPGSPCESPGSPLSTAASHPDLIGGVRDHHRRARRTPHSVTLLSPSAVSAASSKSPDGGSPRTRKQRSTPESCASPDGSRHSVSPLVDDDCSETRKLSTYSLVNIQAPTWVQRQVARCKIPLPAGPSALEQRPCSARSAAAAGRAAVLSSLDSQQQFEQPRRHQARRPAAKGTPRRPARPAPPALTVRASASPPSLSAAASATPAACPRELDALCGEDLLRLRAEERLAAAVQQQHRCSPRHMAIATPAEQPWRSTTAGAVVSSSPGTRGGGKVGGANIDDSGGDGPALSPINGRPMYGLVLPAKEVERVDRAEHRRALGLPEKMPWFRHRQFEF